MCERIKFVLIFTLLITILISTAAQPQSYLITKYSTDNGLPDNRVNDIAQDSLGRIWIAMTSGIAMYDGFEWTKFGEKEGVPEVEYIRIKVDEKGTIWFLPLAAYKSSILSFKNNKWGKINFSKTIFNKLNGLNSIEVIYQDEQPKIFVGSFVRGFLQYFNGNWEYYSTRNGLICDSVTSIVYNHGNIFISTYRGVSVFSAKKDFKKMFFEGTPSNSKILKLLNWNNPKTLNNEILILSDSWIGTFDGSRFEKIFDHPLLPFVSLIDLSSLNFTNLGEILYGNSSIIHSYSLKNNSMNYLHIEDPESDRGATTIFKDYEENIWISSLRGIYKLSYIPFENMTKENGLLESEVSAISEFNSGSKFFGHNYGFSTQTEDKIFQTNIYPTKSSLKISRILDSYHDKLNDVIYFTSLQKGVGKLSKNGKLKWIALNKIENYYSIFEAGKNKIIVSTDMGYAQIINDGLVLLNNNFDAIVRNSAVFNDSITYLATTKGVKIFKDGKDIQLFFHKDNPTNLFSLYYSDLYGLLIGSIKGLYKLQKDSLVKFNFNEYDITDPIYFIIQDSIKNIWLGTNNGVLKWDGKILKRYNKSDGLAGNETNRAAGFVDSKGNVWIGTDEGVSMYTGNESDYENLPPKIMLLDFKDQRNTNYAANVAISLDPEENNITFQYRGLSFLDEKSNSYQIRLKELSGKWANEFYTNTESARFNNLAAGVYVFSVRVKNSKGIWSKWQSSAVITIDKFYYEQIPFQMGVFALFLFLTYSVYSYIQQKKYTQKLEQAVDLRTKNLRDTQVELITSIDRYKGIVDSQADLVVRFDANGFFTFVNDAFCIVFGKSREELLGSSFTPFVHPEDLEKTREEIEKLKVPHYRAIIELRILTSDGYRWFSWEGYAIHNSDGSIMEIQGVGRDITIQREIESELEKRVKERTVELESLISQSPMGIITFNSEGYILNYNNLANQLFGNLSSLIYPDKKFNLFEDEFLLKNNYKDSLGNLDSSNGIIISKPIKIDDIKNEIYKNLVNHFLIYRIYTVTFDENNKIYVLLLEDVTEQQKSEEINNRLLEEKIRFSTIIKTIETERDRIAKELHDGLGQMLTTAKLKLDIIKLKSDKNREEINDALGMLINAGDEIRRIINDLKPSDVERFGLVASIELLCERIKQTSKINVQFSVSNFNSLSDKKDELVLYRIVQEALNNIVKHANCNNAEINMYRSNGLLNIEIWDDGSGYEMGKINDQLNKFGISNIKERVKNLNGQIDIRTQVGEGVQIKIKIPV
ncbi:MAG TPA: PAS domain S-box protein [Ignavibacteriaceae bacterium]